jgi:hypothetical protein
MLGGYFNTYLLCLCSDSFKLIRAMTSEETGLLNCWMATHGVAMGALFPRCSSMLLGRDAGQGTPHPTAIVAVETRPLHVLTAGH